MALDIFGAPCLINTKPIPVRCPSGTIRGKVHEDLNEAAGASSGIVMGDIPASQSRII